MLNRKLKPITYPFMSNDGEYTIFGVDVIYQKYEVLTIDQAIIVDLTLS